MKKLVFILGTLILVLCVMSFGIVDAPPTANLEWKVSVGDSKTLTIAVYYVNLDDDPYSDIVEVTNENGQKVNVTMESGTTITHEITSLGTTSAQAKQIVNGVTLQGMVNAPVSKTVDNKTLWEEELTGVEYTRMEGDLVVIEESSIVEDKEYTIIIKFNYKTGWHEYWLTKVSFTNGTLLSNITFASLEDVPGYEALPVIIGFGLVAAFAIFRKRKKNRSLIPKHDLFLKK